MPEIRRTLKDIALDLLENYKVTSESMIYEFSGDIESDLEDLERECNKYKKEIEEAIL